MVNCEQFKIKKKKKKNERGEFKEIIINGIRCILFIKFSGAYFKYDKTKINRQPSIQLNILYILMHVFFFLRDTI